MDKFDLQLFAENASEVAEMGEATVEKQTLTVADKTFTQADLDKILSARLGKEKTKWEAETKTRLEEKEKEAQRLAKLSEEEKQREAFSKLQKDNDAMKMAIQMRDLRDDAVKILSERKLNHKFADFLLADSSENTLKRIDEFEAIYRENLKEEIKNSIPGSSPKTGVSGKDGIDTLLRQGMGLKTK